jgi:hypothetical protein
LMDGVNPYTIIGMHQISEPQNRDHACSATACFSSSSSSSAGISL